MNIFLKVGNFSDAFGGIMLIIFIVLGAAFYFLPTIIALMNGKNNAVAIGALNFFLGWSLIGWVVALVWSLSSESKTQRIVVNQQSQSKNEDGIDRLTKLKKLLDEDAITQEEFDLEKGKILKK